MSATNGSRDKGLTLCFLAADSTAASALLRNGTLLSSMVIGSISLVQSVSSPPFGLASAGTGRAGPGSETSKGSKVLDTEQPEKWRHD